MTGPVRWMTEARALERRMAAARQIRLAMMRVPLRRLRHPYRRLVPGPRG